MSIDPQLIEKTIRQVLSELPGNKFDSEPEKSSDVATGDGIFADMDSAVNAAQKAWKEYGLLYGRP